jgi:hypothetical protein
MNERIEQLAEQAETWNADGDKCEVDLEKFAELIVRECMSYMEDGDIDFAKFMIRKHFGVEK